MIRTLDARRSAHEKRVDVWIQPHLGRRLRGERHPVHDFLFTYYAYRPAQLRAWYPGMASVDTDIERERLEAVRRQRLPVIRQIRTLLTATASRPANLGCFGLHEWAMVYREPLDPEGHRHDWPLRLGQEATDRVVASHRIGCSHFDAFRFFTPAAIPLNTLQPGRTDREAFEQPGCLHGGMDLYKHAFRLAPLIPAELVADAFELAWDIRILDMRAAPYDFTGVTLDPDGTSWTPVRIETPEGKRDYVEQQKAFAMRAAPLRQRLIDECDRLMTVNLAS
ncbi:MAG: 3-methyladenine DNA glycosylase [Marmoricola sp.]